MASVRELFTKFLNTKVRGRFFNGEIEFSFIGSIAAATATSIDIAGEQWGMKVDLSGATGEIRPIDEGLPMELAVTLRSGAKMFVTDLTN